MDTSTENAAAGFAALMDIAMKGAVEGRQKSFKDVGVERRGDKIILPDGMSYETGREWLTRQEEAEETEVQVHRTLQGYPLDGALALSKAMKKLYGFTSFSGGFFDPPAMISIQTGPNPEDKEQVLWGRFTPPGVQGYIKPGIGMTSKGLPVFVLSGAVKRKHEKYVNEIILETERILREESIYKHRAIHLDLSYVREGRDFHPENDAPRFMTGLHTVNERQLILDRVTEFKLRGSVWSRIEQTEAVLANGVPLKHGVVMAGPYGTGKTLSARVTAAKAVENGWTFIYLNDVRDLALALRFAELYGPSVLFAEDIDRAVNGERSAEMDAILNTLDGIDTKKNPIITVLTTNHPDKINPAFMRAGRIDTWIDMKLPDAEAAGRFLNLYAVTKSGESVLDPNIDLNEAGTLFAGLIPAFIAAGVHQSIMATIAVHGSDVVGKVTMTELTAASEAMREHAALVADTRPETRADRLQGAMKVIASEIGGLSDEVAGTIDTTGRKVKEIHSAITQ